MSLLRGSRGIATIIGGVLLTIALLALIALYFYLEEQHQELVNTLSQTVETRLGTSTLASSLNAYYYYSPLTSTLYITIGSNAPRAVTITALTILWSNTSTTIIDREVALSSIGASATLTSLDGTTTPIDKLPVTMAPGDTLDITISNVPPPTSITLTLSASPAVVTIPIREKINQTIAPAQPRALLLANLSHIAYSHTQTYYGLVQGQFVLQEYALPSQVQVINGSATSLNPLLLNSTDAKTLNVTQDMRSYFVIFTKITNNTIYASDFDNCDAIASGEWKRIGGSWSDTDNGFEGCGIYQANTSTSGGFGGSGEYVAYPGGITIPTDGAVYILALINLNQSTNWHDLVLFDSPTSRSSLIEASAYYSGSLYLDLWTWTSQAYWSRIVRQQVGPVDSNAWVLALLTYYPSTGNVDFYLETAGGQSIGVTNAATGLNQLRYVGVGTWGASAIFDDYIVSRNDPRYLYIRLESRGRPLQGLNVSIYDETGRLIASGLTNSSGIAGFNVSWRPVVRDPVIKIYNGSRLIYTIFLNTTGFSDKACNNGVPSLCGGEEYNIDLGEAYFIDMVADTSINLNRDVFSVTLHAVFSASALVNYTLLVYNWTSGSWAIWGKGSLPANTANNISSPSYDFLSSGIVASNGTVRLRLVAYSDEPFTLRIDMLNVVYKYYSYKSFSALLVGRGRSNYIDVYRLSDNNLGLLYSINVNSRFNGSTVFGYDKVHEKIVLFNTTGLYIGNVSSNPQFSIVTSACRAEDINPIVIVVNASTSSYVVAIPGYNRALSETNDTFCIIDLSNGSIISSGNLSKILGFKVSLNPDEVLTAYATNSSKAFILVFNKNIGEPVIITFNAKTLSWSTYCISPGAYSVGLAYGSNKLWLLLKGGSLYEIESPNKIHLVNISTAFYPWGAGDRLEYYVDLGRPALLFVRADGTNEVWLMPLG